MRAATSTTPTPYIALVDDGGNIRKWALTTTADDGDTHYLEVWLDLSNSPHLTGRTLRIGQLNAVPVLHWTTVEEDFWGNPLEDKTRIQLAGPVTIAFPNNRGWHFPGQESATRPAERTLHTAFTIKNITTLLTKQIVGTTRPNCETNWLTTDHPATYSLHWKSIWRSISTPLSDATEERIWRKLMQRAIYVRNRDPKAPSDKCRLRCGQIESMLHLAQCMHIAPFWADIMAFIARIIPNYTPPDIAERAIIFGQWNNRKMGPMIALATLRHGWMVMYRLFTRVQTNAEPFRIQKVYLLTLKSLRDAALRKGRELAIAHIHNAWSASEPHSPGGYHALLANEISPLVHISSEWKSTPSRQLQTEIQLAETALAQYIAAQS